MESAADRAPAAVLIPPAPSRLPYRQASAGFGGTAPERLVLCPSPRRSGGEAQRIKLVTELSKVRDDVGKRGNKGLHMADVERLIRVLHRLVDGGHSVAQLVTLDESHTGAALKPVLSRAVIVEALAAA